MKKLLVTIRLLLDLERIIKKRAVIVNHAALWWMVDYVDPPANKSLFSVKYLDYIDCINETNTIVSLVEYSGQMGSGTAIFRDDFPEQYQHIPPGSVHWMTC